MDRGRVILTREGREKLCRELEFLKGEKRRAIAKDLARARAHGDLSENAEYDAAKEAQAMNEKRIAGLEDTLTRARLLDDNAMPSDEALLGATVKVKDQNTGGEFDYMLVAEEESDFGLNKISVSSPVGKALLGHKAGDIVEIRVPAGELRYKIIGISR
ncbi:MAG: transcription elongation factor GreA [Candidatus Makaraimicrobium thalassicum]|nr:MAG: transcription elongation factor GreA [Candidatus Omnitrophota bacterium]